MDLNLKRKRVLILPRLQWRLVAAFLSAACISTVVQMLLLNLALTRLANDAPAARGAVLEASPDILWTQIVLTFGLMVPLVVAVGLLETLRVAGPLYRFECYLREHVAGAKPAPIVLRREDELHELGRLINAATQPAAQATVAPAAKEPEPALAARPVAAFVLD